MKVSIRTLARFPILLAILVLLFLLAASPAASGGAPFAYYRTDGSIALQWSANVPIPDVVTYSRVQTETITDGPGLATAFAEALSLVSNTAGTFEPVEGEQLNVNSGYVALSAVAESGFATGAAASSRSRAVARTFFWMRNESRQTVDVTFNWSESHFLEGGINNPDTDKARGALRLRLAHVRVVPRTIKPAILGMIAGVIKPKHRLRRAFVLPSDADEGDLSFLDSDSSARTFTVAFKPGQTYLFGLTALAKGAAGVLAENG